MNYFTEREKLKKYLNEMEKFPLLSRDEEIKLSRRVAKGDKQAFNKLITSNLRLVIRIAQKYIGGLLPLEDLVSEGNVGLIKSVERYNPNKGVKFSTYSAWWIRQSIIKAIWNQSRLIKISHHNSKIMGRIKDAEKRFLSENGHLPTILEISENTEIPYKEIYDFFIVDKTISLDSISGGDYSYFLEDQRENLESEVLKKICLEDIRNLVKSIPDSKERDIIERRFGLNGYPKQTLKEIGELYDDSAETIRCIQNKIFKKIRENNKEYVEILRGYLN
jgi:RNA polymerase primary sigma factor